MTSTLQRGDVADLVAAQCFPPQPGPDLVGLELELLPFRGLVDGTPTARVPIDGVRGSRARIGRDADDGRWCRHRDDGGLALTSGGGITFEPGGQVELSPGPATTVDAALDALALAVAELDACLDDGDTVLAAAGTDLWTERRHVDQQLSLPRYVAMDMALSRRSPWGRVMMRHSASLQVNLDRGTGARGVERWTVANLLAPLCTGTFASSPVSYLGDDGAWSAVSERAVAWQRLDPTRTGVPASFVAGEQDPVAVMVDAALRADVLYVEAAGGESAEAAVPGWTFADWLDGDGPRPVDAHDLGVHLSTLFHDVRPRGPLELRAVDALPARWRDVPVVLLAGALYDDDTASRLRSLLEPRRRDLPRLAQVAARQGLKDPATCSLAVETWSYALDGAARLGVSAMRRRRVEDFLERFTLRGLTPADEIADLTPADAFASCREPRTTAETVDVPWA